MGETQADRTLWVGNLDSRVTEEILYELFLQAGPLVGVKKPSEKNYAFIEFKHDVSVPYTLGLMGGLKLFDRPMRLQFRSGSKHDQNAGSGNNSPNPTAGPGPMMPGGMMPNGTGGMGALVTPPPLQRSLSMPYAPPFPHQMPMQNQFGHGMPFQGLSGPDGKHFNSGLLGAPPGPPGINPPAFQHQRSMPGAFTPSPMREERDGRDRSLDRHHGDSSGHRTGRPYERHQSRDRDRRGSDLRSYSPSLGQSPELTRDQRRGSFHRRDDSPYQQGRQEEDQRSQGRDHDRRQEGGRQQTERGGRNQWRDENRHGHHDSKAERSDRFRDRDDRTTRYDAAERGRHRDESRERHGRSGRHR